MCTALSMNTNDHYFGRTLDLDRSYGEQVCVVPRSFVFDFRKLPSIKKHYAMVGMATVIADTPLFYDGSNEHGLCMAGLNFPGNAQYFPEENGKDNITPFEFTSWILGQCRNVDEAKSLLCRINLVDISFSPMLPLSPLHWMISDSAESIVIEPRKDGLHIHNNPVGVMTNNPPFEYQMENLKKYRYLRNDNAKVKREDSEGCTAYCQGLGAVGLPGDVSSMSRFVRAVFGVENSVCDNDELSSVGQFFHILANVSMVKGSCKTDKGTWDVTGYTSCINAKRGLYYYTTYNNRQISCVDMHKVDLDSDKLSIFPLKLEQSICYCN